MLKWKECISQDQAASLVSEGKSVNSDVLEQKRVGQLDLLHMLAKTWLQV